MSLLRLTNGFDRLADSKLLETSNFILGSMSGNAYFPSPSPTMAELAEAISSFKDGVLAAHNGDRVEAALKRNKRESLVDMLHILGYYVLWASGGSRSKVLTSGFNLAKEPEGIVLTKPATPKVQHGIQQGNLLVSTKKVAGAASYIYQYSTDPLQKDENWMSLTCTSVKCKIQNLQPGTTYYLRVAAVGRKEQVLYSDVVSRMAA